MENYSKSIELASDALEDTDFAEGVQDKWMESMTAKLNTLKASLQDFWNTLLDTGVINTGIGLLSTLVDIGETIINVFKNVGSVFGEIGSGIGGMAGAATILYTLSQGYKSFKDGGSFFGGVANIRKDIIGLPSTFKSLFDTFKEGTMVGRELVREGTIIGNTFTTVSTAASSTTGIVSKLGAGFGALAGKLGISTLALGGWIGAIVAVGAVAIAAWNNIETSAEAAEKAGKKFDEYKKSVDSIQDNKKSADKVMPEFVELSAGVNPDTGANISLTNDEMERYTELSNQIADMFPTLISGYDSQGNAIIKLKDGVASLNEEYEKQLKIEEQKNIDENAKDYVENFNNITGNRGWWTGLKDSFGDTLNYMFTGNAIEIGKTVDNERALEILKGVQGKSVSELQEAYKNLDMSPLEESMLEGLGLDSNIADMTAEQWNTVHATITSKIAELENDLSTSETQMKSIMNSYFNTLTLSGGSYDNMSDELTKNISTFINGLDDNSLKEMLDKAKGNDAVTVLKEYVTDISSKLANDPDAQLNLKNLLSINKDSSIEDIEEIIGKDLDILSQKLGKDKAELTIQLGLEGKEEVIEKYNDVVKTISKDITEKSVLQLKSLEEVAKKNGMDANLTGRQFVSASTMNEKGWNVEEGFNSPFHSQVVENEKSAFVVSPILPNGNVMDKETFNEYIEDIKGGVEDTEGAVLGVFSKKENKNAVKQAKDYAKNIDKSSKYANNLSDNWNLVSDYIKDANVTTEEQLDLLLDCYNETQDWVSAIDEFEFKDFDVNVSAEQIKQLEENLKAVEETIENIDEAYKGSISSMGMSGEEIDNVVKAFSGLEGYNYDKLFESTAEGVHLNAQELAKLNKEYENTEKSKYNKKLQSLTDTYEEYCKQIDEATNSTERNRLINERNTISEQIKEVQELTSRYEGLTNAVSKWQRAKENGEEGDTYDSIVQGYEDAEKLFANNQVGTNEFRAFTQMFSNEDISEYDPLEVAKLYAKRKKDAKRYLTKDDDGNITDVGVTNFLEDLNKIDSAFASRDKNGAWTVNIDTEEAAKQLNISESLVIEFYKKMKDFGAVIDFTEETENLKTLRKEVEESQKVLDKGFQIDFNSVKTEEDVATLKKSVSELRTQFVKDFGENSDQVVALDKQLEWLSAKGGELAQEEWVVDIHSNEGLEELQKQIEKINKIKDIQLSIDFENNDADYISGKIEEVSKAAESMVKDGVIDIKQEGAEEVISILSGLIQKQKEVEFRNNPILNIDVTKVEEESQKAVGHLDNLLNSWETLQILTSQQDAKIPVDASAVRQANEDVLNYAKTIQELDPTLAKTIGIDVQAVNIDKDKIAAMTDAELAGLAGEVTAKLGTLTPEMLIEAKIINEEAIENYNPDKKTMEFGANTEEVKKKLSEIDADTAKKRTLTFGANGLDSVISDLKTVTDKTVTVYTKKVTEYVSKGSGEGQLNGTANFGGTAYKDGTTGNIGAEKDEIALTGEVAPELRVNSKTGQWELLGEHGAEFAHINKGDIIFNGKQTKELFKNGKIKSRGRALVNGTVGKLNSLFSVKTGTAYAGGTLGGSWQQGAIHSVVNANKDSKKKKTKEDNYKETFDWIEVAIDRIERAIKRLDTVAQSAYKSFSKRNSTLTKELSKVREEIRLQEKAYNTYMNAANKISIPSSYKNKIRNGSFNIETLKGEKNKTLVENIKQYQELYEKALDSKEAIDELNETIGDLASQKFDNVVSEYDAKLSEIESKISKIETGLDIVDAKGQFASKNYYDTLMSIEKENINMLTKEYNALNSAFTQAMNEGNIEKYSEQWYSMKSQINDVEEALLDAQKSLIEYKNEMREMDWSIFEKGQEYISELQKESDFLVELLSFNESELFNKDTGKFTNKANAVGGLHAVNYNAYMGQADMYRKKVEELNTELAKDPTNTILIDKKNEYLEAQRQAIKNANDEKMAVKDLISDSYEKMLEILQEMIDKRKEALQAEKDLYDYQKNIESQTKNITNLRKQLLALQGDDSEESQSKRQQLEDQLKSAESELEETEYNQWLSDQEKLLDDLFTEYETVLNARLDNIDGLMSEMIDSTNANASTIDQTIKDTTSGVGYQITDGMKGIWNDTGNGIGKVVSDYSSNFTNTMTTTNNYIQQCVNLLNQIVTKANQESSKNTGGVVKPTTPPSGGSSTTTPPSTTTKPSGGGSKPSSGGNSKPGSFFVYKKDSFPKSKLRVNTSITDRLKYNNFDSSFARRKSYYKSMGLSGTYTGSASQNVAMINWINYYVQYKHL